MAKLRMIEVEMSRGATTSQACRKPGITDQTYYRWRKEYRGMRLERLVADQAPGLAILEEVAKGKY